MKYIFFSIFMLIVFNIIFCRIFSQISKKVTSKRNNISSNAKFNFLRDIKAFLYGFYCYNIKLYGIIPSFTIRHILYRHILLIKIGKGTKVRSGVEFIYPWNIVIGENTMIGKNCIIDARNHVEIGKNVCISDEVAIYTEQHDINDVNFLCNNKGGTVFIEDMAWICFRSIILPKVKISKGAVAAAGSIVTKSMEGFCLYGGSPAKKIGQRNCKINYELDIKRMHFE